MLRPNEVFCVLKCSLHTHKLALPISTKSTQLKMDIMIRSWKISVPAIYSLTYARCLSLPTAKLNVSWRWLSDHIHCGHATYQELKRVSILLIARALQTILLLWSWDAFGRFQWKRLQWITKSLDTNVLINIEEMTTTPSIPCSLIVYNTT